jgi:hypothetical protein
MTADDDERLSAPVAPSARLTFCPAHKRPGQRCAPTPWGDRKRRFSGWAGLGLISWARSLGHPPWRGPRNHFNFVQFRKLFGTGTRASIETSSSTVARRPPISAPSRSASSRLWCDGPLVQALFDRRGGDARKRCAPAHGPRLHGHCRGHRASHRPRIGETRRSVGRRFREVFLVADVRFRAAHAVHITLSGIAPHAPKRVPSCRGAMPLDAA